MFKVSSILIVETCPIADFQLKEETRWCMCIYNKNIMKIALSVHKCSRFPFYDRNPSKPNLHLSSKFQPEVQVGQKSLLLLYMMISSRSRVSLLLLLPHIIICANYKKHAM